MLGDIYVVRYTSGHQIPNLVALYVTQSWETEPNRTSDKIKLTPPAYSHTTVLLVSSLTLVYLLNAKGDGDVKGSNGGF